MTLKVFGWEIKVIKEQGYTDKSGDLAHYSYLTKDIHMEASLKGDMYWSTLIHELFHATFHRVLHQARIPSHLEELIVEALSVAVTENFTLRLKRK